MLLLNIVLVAVLSALLVTSNETDVRTSDISESKLNVSSTLNTNTKTLFGVAPLMKQQWQGLIFPDGQDVETYKAPFDIPKKFVYYLAGYDEENRPIWVVEAGRWFVKGAIEDGHLQEFDRYLKQLAYNCIKSLNGSSGESVDEAVFLVDFEDLQFAQLRHLPTVSYVLGMAREFQPLINKFMGESFIINANYATETLVNLVRPIFGSIFERITVYGNSKSKWMPPVTRKFSAQNLPEYYGGDKHFKPIKVYG